MGTVSATKGRPIFVLNVASLVVGFLQGVAAARMLDLETYGLLLVSTAIVLFLQTVVGLRTGELLLKYYVSSDASKSVVLSHIMRIDVGMTLVVFALTLVISFFYPFGDDRSVYLGILALVVPLSVGGQVFESLYIAEDRIYQLTKYRFIHQSIFLFGSLVLLPVLDAYGYLASYLIAAIVKNVLIQVQAPVILRSVYLGMFKPVERYAFKDLRSFISNSYLSGTFKSGVSTLDTLLLALVVEVDKVAIYKVAKNLALIPNGFLGSVWTSTHNRILEFSKSGSFSELNAYTNVYTRFFLISLVCVLPLLYVFAEDMLSLAYGQAYKEAFLPFIVLFAGNFISYSLAPFNRVVYVARGEMVKMTALNGVSFFFVLLFGLESVSSATQMASVVSFVNIFVSAFSKIEFTFRGLRC